MTRVGLRHDNCWKGNGAFSIDDGQHDAHEGQRGAHEGQHGAAPC